MSALLIGGALALGAILVVAAKKKDEPQIGQGGGEFELVNVKTANGETFFDVLAREGAFGAHARMRVLRFKEVPDGRRVLVTEVGEVPENIRAAARDEFGLLPSPAQF